MSPLKNLKESSSKENFKVELVQSFAYLWTKIQPLCVYWPNQLTLFWCCLQMFKYFQRIGYEICKHSTKSIHEPIEIKGCVFARQEQKKKTKKFKEGIGDLNFSCSDQVLCLDPFPLCCFHYIEVYKHTPTKRWIEFNPVKQNQD